MTTSKKQFVAVAVITLIVVLITALLFGAQQLFTPQTAPTATLMPTPTSWPVSMRFDSPEPGINVHMWWDPWAAVRRDWNLVEEGGFTWIKQRVAWHDVEGAGPGRYEWLSLDRVVENAVQRDLKIVFRVDMPPPWARPEPDPDDPHPVPVDLDAMQTFCRTLAIRYNGRVQAYQVWNEPNLSREWRRWVPDPVAYTQVLRACYIGVKEGDPNALVISAGLSPTGSGPPDAIPDTDYLVGMYEAGAAAYFDLLGVHAPGFKAAPDVSPEVAADPANDLGGHRFFSFRHVEDLREIMVRYGDADKQVAIMEFGWHSNANVELGEYTWYSVTPETQAEYLVGALEYAQANWSPWVGPMFVWNLPDPGWTEENEEFWWAIVDPFWYGVEGNKDLWPGAGTRPAYDSLKDYLNP